VFSFGVLPSKYSGSVAGLQCGRGKAKAILREEKDFALPRLFLFLRRASRRAGGCGRNARRILFARSMRMSWRD